jgi:STE24 endopeptidase
MPIFLILTLVAACLPVPWPEPLFGDLETAATFTVTTVTLLLSAAYALRTWVIFTLNRSPSRKLEVAQVYARFRRHLFFINMGMAAICVLLFGWGRLTQELLVVNWNGELIPAPFAELTVPLPYFAILFGAWIIYYDAERMLHRTTLLGHNDKEYWSRIGYFFNHLRQFVLLVMLPVLLFVAQQTASRFLPETSRSDWYRLASVLAVPLLILLLPLLIKPLLGLHSMPPGPVRTRLEALAKRLHFRCADFLLWPTHGAMANAMIVGLLPRMRYVIFTDRILEELLPDELDAVLGHEIGHAKHGHIWLYALFLSLSISTLAAVLLLLVQQASKAGMTIPPEEWMAPPVILIAGCYIFLVFGYLSRRCERQADVFGCRAVSCIDPNCLGHDESTVYPEKARGLCPTGIRTFISALQRVDMTHGGLELDDSQRRAIGGMIKDIFKWLKSWQHSTMSRRMAFLGSLIASPQVERRFQRRVTILRWGLILGLAATLLVLGQAVTWQKLWESM